MSSEKQLTAIILYQRTVIDPKLAVARVLVKKLYSEKRIPKGWLLDEKV